MRRLLLTVCCAALGCSSAAAERPAAPGDAGRFRRLCRADADCGAGFCVGGLCSDAPRPDVGPADLGGPPDASVADAAPVDLGPPDTGASPDLGPPDTGAPDLGPPDTGAPDLGPPDTGAPDLGPPDGGAAAPVDLSGYELRNLEVASQTFTFPAGALLEAGGVLVLGRDASRAAFEAEWGPLPPAAIYVDAGARAARAPIINGDEQWALVDASGRAVDGPTISAPAGRSVRRVGAAADREASWSVDPDTTGTPGRSAAPSGVGLVISEWSDASGTGRFVYEFVELAHRP